LEALFIGAGASGRDKGAEEPVVVLISGDGVHVDVDEYEDADEDEEAVVLSRTTIAGSADTGGSSAG
jgi:hypothetical protein